MAAIAAVKDSDFHILDMDEGPSDTVVMTCPLFNNTYAKHKSSIASALERFLEHKKNDPLKPYGRRDYPFIGDGPLSGIHHAHLSLDISVFYKIVGRDPRQLRLYGIFSHAESGTGQPARRGLQKNLKTRIDQQPFKDA